MKATYRFSFSKNGSTRYVYEVTGTPEELEAYKATSNCWTTKDGWLAYTSVKTLPNVIELEISKDASFAYPVKSIEERAMQQLLSEEKDSAIGQAAAALHMQERLALIRSRIKQRTGSHTEAPSTTETPVDATAEDSNSQDIGNI